MNDTRRTVWISMSGDYEQYGLWAVAASKEALIKAIKDGYPSPPYVVEWRVEDDTVYGEFQAVPNYSIKHTSWYSLEEHEVHQ